MVAARRSPQPNAAQTQLAGLEDPAQEAADEAAEIEAGNLWRGELWSAMRSYCLEHGYDVVAAALDRRWGESGRPVSPSTLRAALNDSERNHFRLEWVDYFAARDSRIAALLGRRVKPAKSDGELLRDLIDELAEDLSAKRIAAAVRRARTR